MRGETQDTSTMSARFREGRASANPPLKITAAFTLHLRAIIQ